MTITKYTSNAIQIEEIGQTRSDQVIWDITPHIKGHFRDGVCNTPLGKHRQKNNPIL